MDNKMNKSLNPNPYLKANFLSKMFFSHVEKFLKLGAKKPIEMHDMYEVLPFDKASHLYNKFENSWKIELQRDKASIFKALIKCFWKAYCKWFPLIIFKELCKIAQPFILGQLIYYFDNEGVSLLYGCSMALLMGLCSSFIVLSSHLYICGVVSEGMRVSAALSTFLYKKSLNLTLKSVSENSAGKFINIISNDVELVNKGMWFLSDILLAPIQLLIYSIILGFHAGYGSIIIILILIFFTFYICLFGKIYAKYSKLYSLERDERIKLTNESILQLKLIKMFCLEDMFYNIINSKRIKEIVKLVKSLVIVLAMRFPNCFFSKLLNCFLLFFYLSAGNLLSAEFIFITIGIIHYFQMNLCYYFAFSVQEVMGAIVALKRIENFLLLEEIPKKNISLVNDHNTSFLKFTDVSLSWDNQVLLNNINFNIKDGELIAIVGIVGTGKTSILMAILNELLVTKGNIYLNGKIAYFPQVPWLFPDTIKENVIMGLDYNENKFMEIMEAVDFLKDLSLFPKRELSIVGEKGLKLSGGQKARISLARVLYSNADIILLDDPLSAVDMHVSKHIFEKCIHGMLSKKLRLFVTNQTYLLQDVDRIIYINDKQCHIGTYSELKSQKFSFEILRRLSSESENSSDFKENQINGLRKRQISSKVDDINILIEDQMIADSFQIEENILFLPEKIIDNNMEDEETYEKGSVPLRIYLKYFCIGCGVFGVIFCLFLYIFAETTLLLSGFYLAHWCTKVNEYQLFLKQNQTLENNISNMNTSVYKDTSDYFSGIPDGWSYMTTYFIITIICGAFRFLAPLDSMILLVSSTVKIHKKMLSCILRVPLIFLENNSSGRILNRFSNDLRVTDFAIHDELGDFIECSIQVLGTVIVVCILMPWILIIILPIVIIIYFLKKFYLKTSRNVIRLLSTSKSPIFTQINSTIYGLETIRSFGAVDKFVSQFNGSLDLYIAIYEVQIFIERWFATRLDWLCVIFITSISFIALFLPTYINGSLIGFCLSQAIQLTLLFQWTIRLSATIENSMTNVERLYEYTKLEIEPLNSHAKADSKWPSSGAISVQNLYVKYNKMDLYALNNISFDIISNEKIGIVGRTGAGKSSLISSFFRLVKSEGKIFVDGIDILKHDLYIVRKTISILPQDPMLISMNLRMNLDPLKTHTDDQLWEVLQMVRMDTVVRNLSQGLDTFIDNNAEIFSQGQKQLICLARAIVEKNKILVIDEATSSIDYATDQFIQESVRKSFKNCTVLTVAHRLSTIIDSDRIMVLDKGKIVEFDHAYKLLEIEGGFFQGLVKEHGVDGYNSLYQQAKRLYDERSIL